MNNKNAFFILLKFYPSHEKLRVFVSKMNILEEHRDFSQIFSFQGRNLTADSKSVRFGFRRCFGIFLCQAASINYMINDEKRPDFSHRGGGPVFSYWK